MNAPPAKSIASPVTLTGRALFSGVDSSLTVRPAPSRTGLVIRRLGTDTPATLDHLSDTPAHPAFAGLRPRCTSLGNPPTAMTEHALATLAGLGITDAILECDAGELPIGDGSSATLTRAILDAGIETLGPPVEPMVLESAVEYRRDDTLITAEPHHEIDYRYQLDYGPDSPVTPATARWLGDPDDFAASIAPARTFSTEQEARRAAAAGLFESFAPSDLLVIGPDGPIDNSLRFPDECARHKLLDLIGDLALLGRPFIARVHARRSGHADTHAFCRMVRGAISPRT